MYNYKGIPITPNEAYVLLTVENSELEKRLEKQLKQRNMEKHQFKPFDKVLVRDSSLATWRANIYSYLDNTNNHVCISGIWTHCIPYNEQTAHLIGTNKPYTKPQPKTYWVEWVQNGDAHRVEYTDEELENFIKTAVLHNKDIQNFNVRKICG